MTIVSVRRVVATRINRVLRDVLFFDHVLVTVSTLITLTFIYSPAV
jgi:hypothetical protein